MRISIRICDAALALSFIEMATCDPNSIDRIIEDKRRLVPHLRNCKRAVTGIPILNVWRRENAYLERGTRHASRT